MHQPMAPPPQDSILLEGMAFYGYHGVHPEERALGQRFTVELQVFMDLSRPGASDDLADTINYAALHQAAKSILEGPPYHLLEAVAEALAQRVLQEFPINAVRVRVCKPAPPMSLAVVGSAAVEIYRTRPSKGASSQ